jgi:AcrR family transcriptional regulator
VTQATPTTTARRTQAERAAQSDRRLTEAAIQLLIERGVAGTTLAAIGEHAGYSRGLVTHHFGSKAGLLRHVLKQVSLDWLARIDAAVGDKVGVEALCAVLDAQDRFIVEAPDSVRAMYLLWHQSIDPAAEYRANVADVHRAQREYVQRWLAEGARRGGVRADVNVERAAELFCAGAAGVVYHWLVNPSIPVHEMFAEAKRELVERLTPLPARGTRRRSADQPVSPEAIP